MRDYLITQGHEVSVLAHGQLFRSDGTRADLDIPPPGLLDKLTARVGEKLKRKRGDMPHVAQRVVGEVRALQRMTPAGQPVDLLEMEESFGWSGTVEQSIDIPVVTRLHGPYFLNPADHRTPDEKRADDERCEAEGRAVRAARALTAPTRATMDDTCAHYRRNANLRSAVIPNPVALSSPADRWSLDTCEPDHILMVGRFDYRKGADTLLLAFDRLVARRPNARLTFVGPDIGIELTPGHKLMFADFVAEHLSPEARERVDYLGKRPPTEIAALRRRAHVTVVSSRYETYCYTLVEGLAAGCPMISTDWSGSAEIVVDGESGLLTPVADPEAMAETIERVLSQPDLAARLAENGWKRCAETFSSEAVGEQMIEFYRATIEEARA